MCYFGFYLTRNLLKDCNIVYISVFSKNMTKKVANVSFLDTENQTLNFTLTQTEINI